MINQEQLSAKLKAQLAEHLKSFFDPKKAQEALNIDELIGLCQTALNIFKPHQPTLITRKLLRQVSGSIQIQIAKENIQSQQTSLGRFLGSLIQSQAEKQDLSLKNELEKLIAIQTKKLSFYKSLKEKNLTKDEIARSVKAQALIDPDFTEDLNVLLPICTQKMKELASTALRNQARILAAYQKKTVAKFLETSGVSPSLFTDTDALLVDQLATQELKTTAELNQDVKAFLAELRDLAKIYRSVIATLQKDIIRHSVAQSGQKSEQRSLLPNPDNYEPKLSEELKATLDCLFHIGAVLCGTLKERDQLGNAIYNTDLYQLVELHAYFKQINCGNNVFPYKSWSYLRPHRAHIEMLEQYKWEGWTSVKDAQPGEALYGYLSVVRDVLMEYRQHEKVTEFCTMTRAEFQTMCQNIVKKIEGIQREDQDLRRNLKTAETGSIKTQPKQGQALSSSTSGPSDQGDRKDVKEVKEVKELKEVKEGKPRQQLSGSHSGPPASTSSSHASASQSGSSSSTQQKQSSPQPMTSQFAAFTAASATAGLSLSNVTVTGNNTNQQPQQQQLQQQQQQVLAASAAAMTSSSAAASSSSSSATASARP